MIDINTLNDMSILKLRAFAKENGLKKITALRKEALIEAILNYLKENPSSNNYGKTQNGSSDRSQRQPGNRFYKASYPENNDNKTYAASASDMKEATSQTDTEFKSVGILEVLSGGYGFLRSNNFLSSENDVYVSASQIKKFNLMSGDIICGTVRKNTSSENGYALRRVETINDLTIQEYFKTTSFSALTPIFPKERLHLEYENCETSLRIVDLISPIGKGQRGMIVAQPKVGKTTLVKQIAQAFIKNHPELYIIILLIDERPEEVTDILESVKGEHVDIVYSTFDELPEHHKAVSEIVLGHAKRLVEKKKDVVILLDSITRLTRAYNVTITPTGRTLSGGLDPGALYMPKRFFGAARCMKEGGSLTILATALIETGSRLDDMVFEEFKGTGNMELVLSRKLSERSTFPAIDILKSSTRNDRLLLSEKELSAVNKIRKEVSKSSNPDDMLEDLLNRFENTKNNNELIDIINSTEKALNSQNLKNKLTMRLYE